MNRVVRAVMRMTLKGAGMENVVRKTLILSCPFNVVASYLIAFPANTPAQMLGMPAAVPHLYSFLLGAIVLLFGFVYLWMALQPSIDQPLLTVSVLGKMAFFCIPLGLA